MSDWPREFENPFPDFDSSHRVIDDNNKLKEDFRSTLEKVFQNLFVKFEKNIQESRSRDESVYTGISGYALLYMHLSQVLHEPSYLSSGMALLEGFLPSLGGHTLTFLCGDSGPLALAAVFKHKLGATSEAKQIVTRLESLVRQVEKLDSDLPDELLYGRVGYLYSLLFVQKHLGKGAISQTIIRKVVQAVLTSGQNQARQERHETAPLVYRWHNKPYLGAAHGTAGILYMLLQVPEAMDSDQITMLVKPTVDYLWSLRFPSGNFPSSVGSDSDRLLHWCHGAPGTIYLMVKAYQFFRDERYLNAALGCGEVIWQRGILRKGYGICHGTAGNAYAFLLLHKITENEKHLYRAVKFAEWCFDYGRHGCRTPDRPLSLFEGLAGTIYFLADMMNPSTAQFPAFQLD